MSFQKSSYYTFTTRSVAHPTHALANELERVRRLGWRIESHNGTSGREFVATHCPRILTSYDCLVPGAYKADVFRFCAMNTTGGMYVDDDLAAFAPITSMFNERCDNAQLYVEFTDQPKPVRYENSVRVSPAQHPLWECCLQTIITNVHSGFYGEDPCDVTGPGLLTQCVNTVGDVTVIGFRKHGIGFVGRDAPHPVHWDEVNIHIKSVINGAPHHSRLWGNRSIYNCQ